MKNYNNQSSFLIVISMVMLSIFSSCTSSNDKSKSNFSSNAGNGSSLVGHGSNTSSSDNLYASNFSNYKARANSSASNSASGLDMPSVSAPSAVIVEANVQNAPKSNVSISIQSKSFKTSKASSTQSVLVADINSTIKERTVTTVETKSTAKTSAKTSAASSKSGPKKAGELPGEPGYGGPTLPIGDGIWILMSFIGVYAGRKLFFTV